MIGPGDVVSGSDSTGQNTGNLADGISLLDTPAESIQDNLISNNRGYGIHSAIDDSISLTAVLNILDNFIGTDDKGGATVGNLGNGADGIFFDTVPNTATGVTTRSIYLGSSISGNVISGNHANGIDLLNSSSVLITGNEIGTDIGGTSTALGNAADGIFVNQSNNITIGGTAIGEPNIISGNHASGVFISGTSSSLSFGNIVEGNFIGTDFSGSVAIANAVVGIILSDAGGTGNAGNTISDNVISGNLLYGVLLSNISEDNLIQGNLIGTDVTGTSELANTADGVFLLGGGTNGQNANSTPSLSSGNSISGNSISGNIISGNKSNGLQIFGQGATNNFVTNNLIGLGANGSTSIPNLGNGVFLNNAGSEKYDRRLSRCRSQRHFRQRSVRCHDPRQ